MSADHPFQALTDADLTPEQQQATEQDHDQPAPKPSLGIHLQPDQHTQ